MFPTDLTLSLPFKVDEMTSDAIVGLLGCVRNLIFSIHPRNNLPFRNIYSVLESEASFVALRFDGHYN